ncbi:MAG: bifunctional folylpolyglutamate synthase/dihydrofolate synthase [Gammaproteobacteria bacterium]|nr:bifunctional folylpolyglutamate synthase/dihydrofolate synthase [Gammaproteobacteria bacterium]
MVKRSLAEWLQWQESLSPHAIELGLERVRTVLDRLDLRPPAGRVVSVAGTNGKGTTVSLLQDMLLAAGRRPGLYTSPHLVHYNERIRVGGQPVQEADLVQAFESVEAARGDVPLTYFEFGTLAAFICFGRGDCDSWILEVGLGGRLDAVNVLAPDVALITTIGLDHQDWLGETIEEIAAEKAGIMRAGSPAFYADQPVPAAIRRHAAEIGARLAVAGEDYSHQIHSSAASADVRSWSWQGATGRITGLEAPRHWTAAQFRNASLVLAALSVLEPGLLDDVAVLNGVFARCKPDGRFQQLRGAAHEWILDVAHNPQAAAVLRAQLETLPASSSTTIVTTLLADKAVRPFVVELAPVATRWIVAGIGDPRASTSERLRAGMAEAGIDAADHAATPEAAFALAERLTPAGGRIVVCGSFRIVAPALQWLGLY